jgi:hypothetical protein
LQQRLLLKREYPTLLARVVDEVSKIGGIFTLRVIPSPCCFMRKNGDELYDIILRATTGIDRALGDHYLFHES